MFALYNYKPGSTTANILSDIGKILTGTTDLAQLSADCVAANSTLTAQYDSAGWSVHDNNCGVNRLCIKAPCLDGVTFKYVILDMTNTFSFSCYETWNATTHAGTNPIYFGNNTTRQQDLPEEKLSKNSGGYIYLYASAQELIFNFKGAGTWAATDSYRYMVEEFTRLSPNMEVSRGYPCWCSSTTAGSSSSFKSPRLKDSTGSGDAVQASAGTNLYANSLVCGPIYKKPFGYRDSITEILCNNIYPLCESLAIQTNRWDDSQYFENYDTLGYFLTKGLATNYLVGGVLDELVHEGKTYICYGTYGFSHGQVNNWFPKG